MPEMWGGGSDSDHIVFRCGKVRRVRDSWDTLASKKSVRVEDSGHVDDEGRPILERESGFDGGVLHWHI